MLPSKSVTTVLLKAVPLNYTQNYSSFRNLKPLESYFVLQPIPAMKALKETKLFTSPGEQLLSKNPSIKLASDKETL